MKSPTHTAYLVAALLATLCWGAAMTLSKLALGYFAPSRLLVIQLLSSIAFLLCMALVLRARILPESSSKVWWLGILEPGLAYFLGLEGLKRISAAEAVVLSSTESIMIVLLAWWIARQRPRGLVLALVGVGGVGTLLVAGSHWSLGGVAPSLLGDALLVAGVACAAAYVVLSSRLASVTEPLPALIAQQSIAVVLAAVMLWIIDEPTTTMRSVSAQGWLLALSSGIIQYACAFWFYLWALKGLSAGVAGLFLNLIPVFGLLIAMPVLGDQLSATQWLGALLVLGSVLVLGWAKEASHAQTAPPVPVAPAASS